MSLFLLFNPVYDPVAFGVSGNGQAGSLSIPGSLAISLYSDNAGVPGSLIALLGIFPDTTIPSGDSVLHITLPTPIAIPAGRYWIQLTGNQLSGVKWIQAGDDSGSGVATELWYKDDSSNTVTTGANVSGPSYQMDVYGDQGAGSASATGTAAQFGIHGVISGVGASGSTTALGGGTFSRASTATYLDPNGIVRTVGNNVLRYQSGTPLIEAAATNAVFPSVPSSGWSLTNVTTSSGNLAPDGSTNGIALVEAATGTFAYRITQTTAALNATSINTLSCFGKAGSRSYMRLIMQDAADTTSVAHAWFNLSTGTIGTVSVTGTAFSVTATMTACANGWYRCTVSGKAGTTSGSINAYVQSTTADNIITSAGTNGTTAIYVWGIQLEAGTAATSYIATTSGTATRSADIVSTAGVDAIVPSITGAAGLGIIDDQPSLDLSFMAQTLDPRITFSRVFNTATYFDNTGTLQSASANVPRFDYDPVTLTYRGLLIEGGRTNSIRNNTMVGAAAGSPGTLPTNWASSLNGLTRTVVGTGSESGIPYIDIRYNGMTTGIAFDLQFDTTTGIAASNGQTWSMSAYIKLVAGSFTNIDSQTLVQQVYDSVPTFLNAWTQSFTATSASLVSQRNSFVSTIAQANTAFIFPYIKFNCQIGVAIDITIRVGAPQMEQFQGVTSPILTSGSALTRGSDIASMAAGDWYNSTAGSLVVELIGEFGVSNEFLTTLNDGTNQNEIGMFANGTALTARIESTGTTYYSSTTTPPVLYGVVNRGGMAWTTSTASSAWNGTIFSSNGAITGPLPIVTNLQIGARTGGVFTANSWMREIRYWPGALSSSDLISATSGLPVGAPFSGVSAAITGVSATGRVRADSETIEYNFMSGVLDPSLTFTRSSIAYYFDSTGTLQPASNAVPRFEYDPSTVATNYITNSQTIGGTGWTTSLVTVTQNAATAPDGTNTAALIADNTTNGQHLAYAQYTCAPTVIGQTYTGSVYAKAGTSTSIQITLWGESASPTFDLIAGTTSGGAVITSVGNGWYRCSYTWTRTTNTFDAFYVAPVNVGVYTGTGSGAYFWGAQFEIGSTLHSYVPTSGSVASSPATLRGLLIEETRTNSIRNPRAEGGTTGVFGSGGIMPTNWGFAISPSGLTVTLLGTGLENGIPYWDVQVVGTPGSSAFVSVAFESNTQIVASQNQTWTGSAYVKLQAGSLTNITAGGATIIERDSGGTNIGGSGSTYTPTTAALGQVRWTGTRTLVSSSTAFVSFRLDLGNFTSGQAVNVTYRVGAPQMELGQIVTSTILPPVGSPAATTRANELVANTSIGGWYNTSTSTMAVEAMFNWATAPSNVFPGLAQFDDLTVNNRFELYIQPSTTSVRFGDNYTSNLNDVIITTGNATAGTVFKVAASISSSTAAAVLNGGTVQTATPAHFPGSLLTRLTIGSVSGNWFNGYIQRFRYWNSVISNAALQIATTSESAVPQVTAVSTGVSASGQAGIAVPFQPSVNQNITGVSATGQAGTPTVEIDYAITGISRTGQAGTPSAEIDKAITAASGTGQVAGLFDQVSGTVTGGSSTGAAGTFTKEVDAAPSGATGTANTGTITANPQSVPYGVRARSGPSNYIRNPLGTGGTTGTIGSGGVMPTNWSWNPQTSGLSLDYVGTGSTYQTSQGLIQTQRFRWHGTSASTQSCVVSYDASLPQQGYPFNYQVVQSVWVAITSGNLTNVASGGFRHWGQIFNTANSAVVDNQTLFFPTATFTQFAQTDTCPSSGSGPFHQTNAAILFTPSGTGVAIDVTFDIGGPLLDAVFSLVTPEVDANTGGITSVSGSGQAASLADQVSGTVTGSSGTGATGTINVEIDSAIVSASGTGQAAGLSDQTSGTVTGCSSTGSARTLASEIDKALTGVAGTGQAAGLSDQITKTISGNSSTGSAGTPSAEVDKTLTGVAGTGQAAGLSDQASGTITGSSGTGATGTLLAAVSATIAGISATGQATSLSDQINKALTGSSGSGSAGTAKAEIDSTIVGTSATGQAGSLAEQASGTLTGCSGTGAGGTLKVAIDKALTGASATAQAGTTIAQVGGVVGGVSASGAAGTLAKQISLTLTSVSAAGSAGTVGKRLDVTTTGVSATGQAASLTPREAGTLIGVAGTVGVGSLSVEIDKALAGASVSGLAGVPRTKIDGALAGVSGTTNLGILISEVDHAIVGVAATSHAGTVAAQITDSLFGAVGSTFVGPLLARIDAQLSGVAGTGEVGTPSIEIDEFGHVGGVAGSGEAGTTAIGAVSVYPGNPLYNNIANPDTLTAVSLANTIIAASFSTGQAGGNLTKVRILLQAPGEGLALEGDTPAMIELEDETGVLILED